jgi:hypothetical protein
MSEYIRSVTIGRDKLTLTPSTITFAGQTLLTKEIEAISYGIYRGYLNGLPNRINYSISLRDSREHVIDMECYCTFELGTSHAEARFREALSALSDLVIPMLINKIASDILNGKPRQIGHIRIDMQGLHYRHWLPFFGPYYHVPYSNLTVRVKEGRLKIEDKSKTFSETSLCLMTTWNAVLLMPLLGIVRKALSES